MRKLSVPPKETSVSISGVLIRGDLHANGSDSLQVQNLVSTHNNKGGPILIPPKPTINLVPKMDVPEGDATINWDSKGL